MSQMFLDHGEDPTGASVRRHRQELARRVDVDYDFIRPTSVQGEDPGEAEQAPAVGDGSAREEPLDGLERHMYVEGEDGDEQFNDAWMRDHWHGRQGGAGGFIEGRGSIGSGIGADLLAADRGAVFADRAKPGPSAPAQGWDRLSQGWLGAFLGGIFGGKGRAFRNAQQAQRRKLVTDAYARGGAMPEWVRASAYGQRKWAALQRGGRR